MTIVYIYIYLRFFWQCNGDSKIFKYNVHQLLIIKRLKKISGLYKLLYQLHQLSKEENWTLS